MMHAEAVLVSFFFEHFFFVENTLTYKPLGTKECAVFKRGSHINFRACALNVPLLARNVTKLFVC